MCDAEGDKLNICRSYHASETPKLTQTDGVSKSDLNFIKRTTSITVKNSEDVQLHGPRLSSKTVSGEYYKKYEHDELPVKDSDNNFKEYGRSLNKGSLTNSYLDNLEQRIYKNVSQELQTDDGSLSSLDSNIKFFKTTVETIFDNFYTSMRDFELYKKRFHEILAKSKEGVIDDMEDFIKDMFDHIMSSENSISKISRHSAEITATDYEDRDICVSSSGDSGMVTENGTGFADYKNEQFLTDSSTVDETCFKTKKASKKDGKFHVFLIHGDPPCLEIKLGDRNLLSEINVKQPTEDFSSSIASADNLKMIAAKRLELEKYIREQDHVLSDRDIPVKSSDAKKNIYLNEDFAHSNVNNETSRSFLSKICNLLCRKFRKSSFI